MSVSGSETLRPERFIAGGEALAHGADGRVVFVRGGIPGDEVVVDPLEDRDAWSRAVVRDVVVASSDRVEPPCPKRRNGCGGCDWQHLALPAQLPAKAEIVRDALRRTGHLPEAVVVVGSAVPADGHRTTIRVVGDHHGAPAFRRERSHDVVPAAGCPVAHPNLRAILDGLRIDPGLEVSLRTSVATGASTAWWDPSKGVVSGLGPEVSCGPSAALSEVVSGHRFAVSAASFFQSGPSAAELLVDAVRRSAPELASALVVADLYAGVGLFAATVVPTGARAIAVESSRTAVIDCRANLAGSDARVEQGQVGQWRPRAGERIDVVVADPSRTGLGKPGVAAVAAAGAPIVVLVSCDPVAMARDAALLGRHGYDHDGTEVLDLFPHTHHVECVTRFVHR
ncbi:MAG: class I SAM-dependent RNA methyltransferase [Ilumatobacteraceae bacterium]